MKVKFQGGPQNNKYQEFPNDKYTDRLELVAPDPALMRQVWSSALPGPSDTMHLRRGHYARSNKTLKNGAVVFIWMGWVK